MHLHQLTRTLVIMLCAGCGGGYGSATIKSKGTTAKGVSFDETLNFGSTDKEGSTLTPFYASGGVSMQFYSDQQSAGFQGRPKLYLTLASRRGDAYAHGLGPMQGQSLFETQDTSTIQSYGSNSFFIDEWRATGDGSRPISVKGRMLAGDNATLSTSGSFEFTSRCESAIDNPAGALCGDLPPQGGFSRAILSSRGAFSCAPEVLKAFVGGGVGANATYAPYASVKVDGADLTFSCVRTAGSAGNVLCGAEKSGISAGGCSWRATALAMPSNNAGKPLIQFWVGALANEGCSEPACNTQLFTADRN